MVDPELFGHGKNTQGEILGCLSSTPRGERDVVVDNAWALRLVGVGGVHQIAAVLCQQLVCKRDRSLVASACVKLQIYGRVHPWVVAVRACVVGVLANVYAL